MMSKKNSTHKYWIMKDTGKLYYFRTKNDLIDYLVYLGNGADWGKVGTEPKWELEV